MKSLEHFSGRGVRVLFTDIDDTLTTRGRLRADVYSALWKLRGAGVLLVPITGRPAGWCDMVARFWPVHSVIGENGAFYFSYDESQKKMKRVWAREESLRVQDLKKLKVIEAEVLTSIPGAAVSADQFSRLVDLAIDFCEDVPALPATDVDKIVAIFQKHGAQAKVSSIHVNGWFGDHNKLTMCQTFCRNELGLDPNRDNEACAFTGDSPNDEPMFGFFKKSVGMANVQNFKGKIQQWPQYVTPSEDGAGFVEFAEQLLKTL